jgi:Tfp pilus assembly protein PilF
VSNFRAYHANLQRGILLLQQRRPQEAVKFLQQAIAEEPNQPQAYAELAQCWVSMPNEGYKALQAIDRAISLEPADSVYYGLKGWIFVCLDRYQPALNAARQGLALDPNCMQSLNAEANAHSMLHQWKKAEASCRRMLELNPYDNPALNLLAQALRHQGRWKESRVVVDQLLAQVPNDAFGLANAGHGALAAGDHLRANEHFLQALQMDPNLDLAREGLLNSLRARIWILRMAIRIGNFFRYAPTFRNLMVAVGTFWAVIFSVGLACFVLEKIHPGLGGSFLKWFCIGMLGGILWFAATAVLANFLLLFDPLGRHALTFEDKIKACMPGGGFLFAIAMIFFTPAWKLGVVLILLVVAMVLVIQFPLMKDRWLRWRERTALSGAGREV